MTKSEIKEVSKIIKEYKAKIIHCNKNDCTALDYVIEQSVNDWILVLDKNEILPLNLLLCQDHQSSAEN